MAARLVVPITGSVLRWAIREGGFSEHDLAPRLGVAAEDVVAWEEGEAKPTRGEFAKLVNVLKRPSALFFLPSPPVRFGMPTAFRNAPGAEGHGLSPRTIREVRTARRLQEATSWLLREAGEKKIDLPRKTATSSPGEVAETVRPALNVPLSEQLGWPDDSTALSSWRRAFEAQGLLVFALQLGHEDIRGFSAWDDWAPMAAVSTSYLPVARIYTLAHELGHLLLRADAACRGFPAPDSSHDPRAERWCEKFAASFLLPASDFVDRVRREFHLDPSADRADFEVARRIAHRFKVSIRAVAIRLMDFKLAPPTFYGEVERHARIVDFSEHRGRGRGVPTPEKRLGQFGRRCPAALLRALDTGMLGQRDVADYLKVNLSQLQDLDAAIHLGERARSRPSGECGFSIHPQSSRSR